MIAAIQSPFIQRLAPYFARLLHVMNIASLCLSLLLFVLLWSLTDTHTEESFELVQSNEFVMTTSAKRLDKAQLWFVDKEFGGGVIVTDSNGMTQNRLGEQSYAMYLANQSALMFLITGMSVTCFILLISNNYLRLVSVSTAIVVLSFKLQTPYLFSQGFGIATQANLAILLTTLLLLAYWIGSKWLLHNNHISDTLIAYASQSGSAMSLAKRFKKSIAHTSDVRCLSSLNPNILARYNEVLIIASTYGDGQPPEKVKSFVRKLNDFDGYVEPVNYSILALGDTHYPHFCAFGHQLEQLLNSKGAKSLFNLVEVDKLDIRSINTWWQGLTNKLNWQTGELKQTSLSLQVTENTCLNPSQTERQAHSIRIDKQDLDYSPGDLLEVTPQRSVEQANELIGKLGLNPQEQVFVEQQQVTLLQALTQLEWHGEQADNGQQLVDKLTPLSARVYSIASTPEQDFIEIFVRRYTRPDGNLGVASNYLCNLDAEQTIQANIRTHSNFHLPAQQVPLILIGAGTGIAPLIGFLRHRAATGSTEQHWLMFGEQYQQSDFYFAAEIEQLQQQNILSKLSLAWSREENGSYIGEHIEQQSEDLLSWVYDLDAHIYVCGSQTGFGDSVCSILANTLGNEQYEKMLQSGSLRTDLY